MCLVVDGGLPVVVLPVGILSTYSLCLRLPGPETLDAVTFEREPPLGVLSGEEEALLLLFPCYLSTLLLSGCCGPSRKLRTLWSSV